MPSIVVQTDPDVAAVAEALERVFPKDRIKVYRYNSVSLRVRVLDSSFEGLSFVERGKRVDPILRELPERIESQITARLYLTEAERKTNLMSLEFDKPSRPRPK